MGDFIRTKVLQVRAPKKHFAILICIPQEDTYSFGIQGDRD